MFRETSRLYLQGHVYTEARGSMFIQDKGNDLHLPEDPHATYHAGVDVSCEKYTLNGAH